MAQHRSTRRGTTQPWDGADSLVLALARARAGAPRRHFNPNTSAATCCWDLDEGEHHAQQQHPRNRCQRYLRCLRRQPHLGLVGHSISKVVVCATCLSRGKWSVARRTTVTSGSRHENGYSSPSDAVTAPSVAAAKVLREA